MDWLANVRFPIRVRLYDRIRLAWACYAPLIYRDPSLWDRVTDAYRKRSQEVMTMAEDTVRSGWFAVGDRVGELADPYRRGEIVLIDKGVVVVRWDSGQHVGYHEGESVTKIRRYRLQGASGRADAARK